MVAMSSQYKSPLNFIGGKVKVLNQTLPFFLRVVEISISVPKKNCINKPLALLIKEYKDDIVNRVDEAKYYIEKRIYLAFYGKFYFTPNIFCKN